MDVLIAIGIITGILLIFVLVQAYNNYIENLKGKSIYAIGRLFLFVVAEGIVCYVYYDKQNIDQGSFIALVILACLIAVGCLAANIVSYGPSHGIIITIIQSATAALLLVLILLLMAATGSKKKNTTKLSK